MVFAQTGFTNLDTVQSKSLLVDSVLWLKYLPPVSTSKLLVELNGKVGYVLKENLSFTSGQITDFHATVNTNTKVTDAYNGRISSFTTNGSSGKAAFSGNILNVPNYTLSGLGGQPQLNGNGFVKANGTSVSYDNTVAKISNYSAYSIPFISDNYNLSPTSLIYYNDQDYPEVYNDGSFTARRHYSVPTGSSSIFFGTAGGSGALISDNIYWDDDAGTYYQFNPMITSSSIQTTRSIPFRVYTTPAGSTTTTTLLRTYTNGNFKIGSNATDTGFKLKVEGTGSFDGTVKGANATLGNEFVTLGQLPTLSNIVTNASTSTDNAIARFDGTTGKILQNSSVFVDDNGVFTANGITKVYQKRLSGKNNLGDPTVEEMAIIHGQFTNKFRFISPFTQEESADGVTWSASIRATAEQLGNMMRGEGEGTVLAAISAPTVGVPGAAYRLTWDASQTGYVFLNSLYVYCSTSGNSINFKIEKYHNTTGWVEEMNSTINNWPGHVFLPHNSIPFSTNASQYGKVRITFQITTAAQANNFTLYAIEWFGGYPAGRRNVESYDRHKNVTFPNGIGVGGSAPLHKLDFALANSSTQQDYINFAPYDGGRGYGSGITWKPNYSGYTKRSAGILQIADGTYFRSGLAFFTNSAADHTTDWTEKMRITGEGNLLIGTTTDNETDKLQVNGTISASNAILSNHAVMLGQLPTLSNLVTNASTSTDNYVVRFDGTTGKILQNSRLEITDLGIIIPRYQHTNTSFYIGEGTAANDGQFSFSNNNIGIGSYSLNKIAGGDDNLAIGHDALLNVVTTSQNTAVGNRALRLSTSSRNTALGYGSGDRLTTGTENVSAGYLAGSFISGGSTGMTTNSYSIYLGSQSKASANGLSNEVVIGYNAVGNGSNTVTLGNTNNTGVFTSGFYLGTNAKLTNLTDGYIPYHISDASGLTNSNIYYNGTNIGIGTTAPSEKLEVNGSVKINGTIIGKATQALIEISGAVAWNYLNGSSASVTIDEPTVITLSNVPDGAEGNIYIVQGDSGNDNVTFAHSGLTVKWRGGDKDLTDAAGSYDVVSFWRAGSILFVTLGSDYINQ